MINSRARACRAGLRRRVPTLHQHLRSSPARAARREHAERYGVLGELAMIPDARKISLEMQQVLPSAEARGGAK